MGCQFYKQASAEERLRLDQTMRYFGYSEKEEIIGESLLRLRGLLDWRNYCPLPLDSRTRRLFQMFYHYEGLA